MRANSPNQRCPALSYPIAEVVLQLVLMKAVLSYDPERGSRYDIPLTRRGRTSQF